MTQEGLEYPSSLDEIYLARSPSEVERARPFLTGDVFRDITIPGVDNTGQGIIITHPCSMRSDGVELAEKLLVARVSPSTEIPLKGWGKGYFNVMPLPGMMDEHWSAKFNEIGLVRSEHLLSSERIACLTPYGINLLQQKFIWYLTRFLVETHRLSEVAEAVFEEAELCEEWVVAVRETGSDEQQAARSFHEWIRSKDSAGNRRQELLADPQQRAGIRRQMKQHLAEHCG